MVVISVSSLVQAEDSVFDVVVFQERIVIEEVANDTPSEQRGDRKEKELAVEVIEGTENVIEWKEALPETDVFLQRHDSDKAVQIDLSRSDEDMPVNISVLPNSPSRSGGMVANRSVQNEPTLVGSPLTSSIGIAMADTPIMGELTSLVSLTAADFDPFEVLVKWDWKGVSVGEAIKRVSNFAGYTLVVRDDNVKVVYSKTLPIRHRVVSGVSARTALELLAGPAYTVLVNHADRTVIHTLKPGYLNDDVNGLPRCPENLAFAFKSGDKWVTESGLSCVN